MAEEWKMPSHVPSSKEWAETGVWMRGSAGTGGRGKIVVEGKEITTRKMKGVEGANLSDDGVDELLRTPVRETFYVMQKSEGAKVRPVVKTGNKINRMMDYLSVVWEDGMRG